jgi:glycerol-3-phosphate dehydrogenase (NAD(P)+)
MADNNSSPITVLGAGSWGTALAVLLARNDQPTRLWARDAKHIAAMEETRRNRTFLPDIDLPQMLGLYHDLKLALTGAQDVLIAVPSAGFREILTAIRPHLAAGMRVAWATKGLEAQSGRLLHEVAAEVLGQDVPVAVISGPTFAHEVAIGLPTAVTVASATPGFAADIAIRLHSPTFRAYTSDDVTGVSMGGAVKNVLAIAAGIADGLGLGANTRAALVTRGLAEMMRLGVAMGGKRETFMGLAGLGDLVLTCTDNQSRNRRVGVALAEGVTLEAALKSVKQSVEGVPAACEVMRLAARLHIEMPISEQVYHVLYDGRSPREAVYALLRREAKPEGL